MKCTLPLVLAIAVATVSAADWPQFHGPNRDNKSPDKGLLKTWPEGGPSRIWEAAGIGEGYSTVSIAGKRIYTTGAIDDDCVITALDPDGKKVWTRKNGKAWARSYPGTRSIPTITDGLLYHLSGVGNLLCLRADSGEVVWSTNILEKFGGRNITWGLAESPLVIGGKVICTPGGEDVSMVALDRKTGKVVWKCTGAGDRPGYASAILIEYQGLKQIVTAMSESIVGVRASDGKLLWQYPHKVYADENITTPIFHDGFVIVSGCVKKGTTSLELQVSGDECSVKRRWHNKKLDSKQGGIVLVDGRLYGCAEFQRSDPWMCIDFKSGETIFQGAPVKSTYKYKMGCLTYADGMLYLYADNGNMCLAKPTDKGFEVAGRLKIKDPGKNPTWAHPVVLGGRLYIRYGDRLGVYNVAGSAAVYAADKREPAEADKDGFVSIFDGKTLKGWEATPAKTAPAWTVKDGMIVGNGDKGRGYIAYENGEIADLELKLSYRFPGKGNSGISIRARKDTTGRRHFQSYHADLGHVGIGKNVLGAWDFHTPGRKEHACFRGNRLVIDEKDKPKVSKIEGAVTTDDIKKGGWNTVHIIVKGNNFKFFINGKPASEFTEHLPMEKRLDKGMILLQLHDPGMIVHFKDIRLKILK